MKVLVFCIRFIKKNLVYTIFVIQFIAWANTIHLAFFMVLHKIRRFLSITSGTFQKFTSGAL